MTPGDFSCTVRKILIFEASGRNRIESTLTPDLEFAIALAWRIKFRSTVLNFEILSASDPGFGISRGVSSRASSFHFVLALFF
jgi:hypothetical protein